MTRRTLMQLPAAAAAPSLNAAGAAQTAAAPGGRKPNILFLMVDQMTPFMIGPYGQKAAITPNLDRLARSGAVFDNAYCNAPLCVPSRASMFSGRLPSAIDAWDNASEFRADIPTIMHYLRAAGYQTSVSGKTHFIGPDQYHGFHERLTPCIYPTHFKFMHAWSKGPYWIEGTSVQTGLGKLGVSEINGQIDFDSMTLGRALERLNRYALDRKYKSDLAPLFLNVSFTHPHDPYCAPRKYLDMYRDAEIPMPKPYDDIRKLSPTYEWVRIVHGLDKETPSPDKVREARRCYLAMCTWIDERIGQLLAEVERLGMARDTLVVLTGDHGDMCGEKGQWFKRIYLEWSARVPLIASWPGRIPAGRRVAAPVSLLDLLPTFAEAAQVAVTTHIDGRSLLPLAEGREEGRDHEVIGEYFGEATIEPIRMVRRGDFKYIATHEYPPQLYDLKRDPDETVNAAGRPEYRTMEAELHARAEKGWDAPELKRRVMTSHAEREFLRNIPDYLVAGLWQPKVFEPVITDESGWR
jgi:choline-sulfatase